MASSVSNYAERGEEGERLHTKDQNWLLVHRCRQDWARSDCTLLSATECEMKQNREIRYSFLRHKAMLCAPLHVSAELLLYCLDPDTTASGV